LATRAASGKVINAIAEYLPMLIGGSADLEPSNNTMIKGIGKFSADDRSGKNFHFGIREHGMASIMNGMALYGGIIPYGGTFLVFSDYLRPAIRLASISGVKVIYVFTHDSVGLGEDGPTHQPVEHFAALRAIPKLVFIRPSDATETVEAWKVAIEHKGSPVALILTRQKLPVFDRKKLASAENLNKGAYIIKEAKDNPQVILMASGSEVYLAIDAAEKLQEEGINVRVVSFPSWELFEKQDSKYKSQVLPEFIKARVAIEAGISLGWKRYVGDLGEVISIEKFGASAPYTTIFENYGFTPENIVNTAKKVLNKIKGMNA
ncbi:MAG: transketolase C-terminal domain-containing protein, partial [Ignavibacteriaceae bacterium]